MGLKRLPNKSFHQIIYTPGELYVSSRGNARGWSIKRSESNTASVLLIRGI